MDERKVARTKLCPAACSIVKLGMDWGCRKPPSPRCPWSIGSIRRQLSWARHERVCGLIEQIAIEVLDDTYPPRTRSINMVSIQSPRRRWGRRWILKESNPCTSILWQQLHRLDQSSKSKPGRFEALCKGRGASHRDAQRSAGISSVTSGELVHVTSWHLFPWSNNKNKNKNKFQSERR